MKTFLALIFLFVSSASFSQDGKAGILETILSHYYKNEKAIYKGRNQLLYTYCEKANNNEEIFETVNQLKLPPNISANIRHQIGTDTALQNWSSELESIFAVNTALKMKVNACLTLEEYQVKQKRFNLNNQRLMIISKPILYPDGKTALVKVVFYRSIEHNSGSVLRMEKSDGKWIIKEFLNSWST